MTCRPIAPAGPLERTLEAAVEEVAEQEHDRPAVQHAIDVVEPLADRGAAVRGLKEEHVADEPQHMPGALARRHKALDAVGELHESHLVVVADRAEGEHRR